MKVDAHLTLYRDPRYHAAFPAAAVTADGTMLVLFRRARDVQWLTRPLAEPDAAARARVDHLDTRSHLVLMTLDAQFRPAEPLLTLSDDAEAADQDANVIPLPDGRILIAGFSYYPVPPATADIIRAAGGKALVGRPDTTGCLYLFWGAWTRLADADRSWRPRAYLPPLPDQGDTVPGVRAWHGGALRGRPLLTADGTVLIGTYAPDPVHGAYVSHLYGSTDLGQTWAWRACLARDPTGRIGHAEPALAAGPKGTIVALCRSFGVGGRLITTCSSDQGQTWSKPETHAVVGHPFDALTLPDGRVLISYGYRSSPYGVRCRLWCPAQTTIADTPEFVVRSDSANADTGYPWAILLADGRVLIVYYLCDESGVRHIAGSVLTLPGL